MVTLALYVHYISASKSISACAQVPQRSPQFIPLTGVEQKGIPHRLRYAAAPPPFRAPRYG